MTSNNRNPLTVRRLLEETAGEYRITVRAATPTGRSTWRSQPYSSKLEAQTAAMEMLSEQLWVGELLRMEDRPELLPDSVLAKRWLREREAERATEDALD